MASPDSTSSHGEANKQVENKFQRKPPSPEYVNSSISSTVNTEISSTTQIAGPSGSNSENSTEKKDDQMEPTIDEAESPTEVTAKGRKEQPKISKVEFNGPILRSTGSVSTPSAIPSPKQSQEPSTETVEESQEEFVSCDSHGDLSEAEKCDSQEINNTENPETLDKVSDEASGEVVENEEKDSVEQSESKGDEQPEEKDETLGCDSQGEQLAQMDTEVENEEFPQEIITEECQDASQEAQQGSPQEEPESAAEEEIEESVKKDEEVVRDTDDDDDTSIDFEDFDTVSEYSDMESNENEADCKAKDNEPSGEKIQSRDPVDMDKSIDAAMINFDPSEAFKDTSDVESQHGDVQEMQVKDNLFENISSIESTEHNYLDNCALLASNQNGDQQNTKNPSPDSSNAVNHASHCTTPSDPMEMNCDTIPDTSNVASNGLNMDEQRTYVEHDGLFSSPIYDPEPDERSKFNGQMTDQLMYTHNHSNNMLLEPDSSENNIPRNLAIDDLVEEMPSDDTTLMTESDIFEEYCENLTSIGDNVTVETESEIVTEPFVSETGGTDDFVFRTTLPHEMQTTLPTSTYISATSLAVPEVLATRKSDRQRIKSHTNLYVEHDYSPRTDTNRITPITSTSRTGDRYLLPPKTEKMNRKRSFPGDGRDRKKQRKTYTMPESTLSPLPQLPTIANPNPQIPLPVMPQRPPVEQQLRAKAPVSSVSPYLEVHNSLQQQMGRQRCVIPLLPSPTINGDTATMRKFRRPNRMEHTPPHTLPVYEQISPCPEKIRTTGPEMKTFSMIPSNQSIAALASVAQKYPPKSVTEIGAAKKDAFSQGIGEYQILQYTSPNPTDYCIIAPAREPPPVPLPAVQPTYPNSAVSGNQSIHTAAGKVFLTAQPEDVPQFVVGESDDLVSTCLSSSK